MKMSMNRLGGVAALCAKLLLMNPGMPREAATPTPLAARNFLRDVELITVLQPRAW
jgi:hypothetical protein